MTWLEFRGLAPVLLFLALVGVADAGFSASADASGNVLLSGTLAGGEAGSGRSDAQAHYAPGWGANIHYLDGHCSGSGHSAAWLAGTIFTKDKRKGVKWAVGATVFGTGLTTQQAWSSNNTSQWHFGRHYRRYYLCGSNDYPITAQRVFAGL